MTRVAINAGITPGQIGGTANFLLGLIQSLGNLQDGNEEYVVVAAPENIDQLKSYMGPNQSLVALPSSYQPAQIKKSNNPLLNAIPFRLTRKLAYKFLFPLTLRTDPLPKSMRWVDIPVSDGFYESLGCDLIHFPYQGFTLCAMPSIYQPWDLQHRHYPQFFEPIQIAWRETILRAGCDYSTMVVVASEWTKQDVIRQFGIHSSRLRIVPVAPPTQAETITDPEAVKRAYSLPDEFILYPAVTWAHKNHQRLLEALTQLRDRDNLRVHLVCTGALIDDYFTILQKSLAALRLESQVTFLGFIPASDLRAIYRLSEFVIFPSLFEGAGLPPLEAWTEGKAVACSNAATLPEIVSDAALLFDPLSIDAIDQAIKQMYTNKALREDFQARGKRRLQNFSWDRTARIYRALYRTIANAPLTEEDIELLKQT